MQRLYCIAGPKLTMAERLPESGLRVMSTVRDDSTVRVELVDGPVSPPGPDEVLVRISAAPIHPADIIGMLAGADPAKATFSETAGRPGVSVPLDPHAAVAAESRLDIPVPIGLEGAGAVVAAGSNVQQLIGRTVGFNARGKGSFAEYCTVSAQDCIVLEDGNKADEGAALFCNPLTALAMIETLYQTGERALVHTAAASSLGQMLVKICLEDNIPLVNIVRRHDQAELLKSIGAQHVCISNSPAYRNDLLDALRKTGARVAFDAIGGGSIAGDLLSAMETVACERAKSFNPYGSSEHKRVYIYGRLDPGPTLVERAGYGMVWSVDGWAMPPIIEKAGAERREALMQRIARQAKSTFASEYGAETSLIGILSPSTMIEYCRQATGGKYLVRPTR